MQPVLSIRGLSKSYKGGLQALKAVDLDIQKGEIFALLGPNGAGKTTLINAVCGIVTPTTGVITAAGYDTRKEYRVARSLIGLVPQEMHIDIFETVWAVTTYSRGLFGLPANNAHIAMGQEGREAAGALWWHEAARPDRQSAGARA